MIPVNKNDYDRLKKREEDRQTIQVTFHKDNFVAAAQYHCLKQNDSYYVILSFDNYIQRYLNQRYLYVSLTLSETKGLKIPSSSLVKKEVYKIPKSFLVNGRQLFEKRAGQHHEDKQKGRKGFDTGSCECL